MTHFEIDFGFRFLVLRDESSWAIFEMNQNRGSLQFSVFHFVKIANKTKKYHLKPRKTEIKKPNVQFGYSFGTCPSLSLTPIRES